VVLALAEGRGGRVLAAPTPWRGAVVACSPPAPPIARWCGGRVLTAQTPTPWRGAVVACSPPAPPIARWCGGRVLAAPTPIATAAGSRDQGGVDYLQAINREGKESYVMRRPSSDGESGSIAMFT
jgi:hypothetical protein